MTATCVVEHTDPYPWPWTGALDVSRTAVVVAGAQPAWIERSLDTERVAAVIATVAGAVRAAGGCALAIRHSSPPSERAAVSPGPALPPAPGTPPAEVVAPIAACTDEIVDAAGINGFHGGRLDDELRRRGIVNLVLCGFGAEAAVDSSLRAANDRGYECLTLSDAVAPFDRHTGRHALCSITMSGGIFGAIGTSDCLLSALGGPKAEEAP